MMFALGGIRECDRDIFGYPLAITGLDYNPVGVSNKGQDFPIKLGIFVVMTHEYKT